MDMPIDLLLMYCSGVFWNIFLPLVEENYILLQPDKGDNATKPIMPHVQHLIHIQIQLLGWFFILVATQSFTLCLYSLALPCTPIT